MTTSPQPAQPNPTSVGAQDVFTPHVFTRADMQRPSQPYPQSVATPVASPAMSEDFMVRAENILRLFSNILAQAQGFQAKAGQVSSRAPALNG